MLSSRSVNNAGYRPVTLEEHYQLFSRPGAVRVLGFYTRARMGVFSTALHLPGDINENIAQTRHYGHENTGLFLTSNKNGVTI